MIHGSSLTAKAELRLYLTARGREPGFALMFTDKIEDLLLATGQGFHTVQGNIVHEGARLGKRNGATERRGDGVLEYWSDVKMDQASGRR